MNDGDYIYHGWMLNLSEKNFFFLLILIFDYLGFSILFPRIFGPICVSFILVFCLTDYNPSSATNKHARKL